MTANWGQCIRSTRPGEINALAFKDIKVWTCDRQIRDMLRKRLGDSFLLCLASPVENKGNGNIDWYSPISGKAAPFASLPEDLRKKITDHLQAMGQEINAIADELIQTGDPIKVTRGNILKRALSYPDESYIYAIDEQPVITAWGFAPGTPGVEGAHLTRMPAPKGNIPPKTPKLTETPDEISSLKSPPAKAVIAASTPLSFWWLWWLLPLLALLFLLFLLFSAFGPVHALGGKDIFHLDGKPFMEELPKAPENLNQLRQNAALLEKQLETHIAQCVPQAKTPVTASIPKKEANALEIPEHAENLDFLSGRWLCETGLANTRTGEPVKVLFNFDGSGKGDATIIESSDQCEGPANATLENGILRIELDELKCRRQKFSYGKTMINCENSPGSETLCAGRNYDGTTWGATFMKLR